MVYESSYESGQKPFRHDLQRGKWEKPTDFLYAAVGLSLKLDVFVASYWFFFDMGIFGMMPYFIYMVVYLVPILVVHSFMGQFSSSGFISAFRLAPFFKGMGYVSLFLSVSMLIYYSIFAAVPLIYLVGSLRPTLPWSCEGIGNWINMSNNTNTICNKTNTEISATLEANNETDSYLWTMVHVPSVMYFKRHFQSYTPEKFSFIDDDYELSWHFVGHFIVVWAIVSLVFYKFSDTAKFGKFLRYMVISTIVLLLICFVRFLFLPGALDGLTHYLKPRLDDMGNGGLCTIIMMLQALGAGWGSIISLSSFNEFKTKIMNYSWIIAFGQIFIYIMFGMVTFMLEHFYKEIMIDSYEGFVENHWILFLSSASVLASLELPHLWTILYYTMLLLAALIVMTTQIFTIIKSLFDEFEGLRLYKQEVTFGLIGGLAVCSSFFCTNHGVLYFSSLSLDAIFSHSMLHLMLLLVILWIYGRERFQRDIEFMLGQPFASWKIFILRFIAPVMLLFVLLMGIFITVVEHSFSSRVVLIISTIMVLIPLLFIPGYGIYHMWQGSGTFCIRFRRACRPTDWYPLESDDRQQYEEAVGTSDITHQLYEVTEEVN